MQEKMIWQHAEQVMQRNEGAYSYILYQLNSFYIEIKYSITLDEIVRLQAYEYCDKLDPFLLQINIEYLLTK